MKRVARFIYTRLRLLFAHVQALSAASGKKAPLRQPSKPMKAPPRFSMVPSLSIDDDLAASRNAELREEVARLMAQNDELQLQLRQSDGGSGGESGRPSDVDSRVAERDEQIRRLEETLTRSTEEYKAQIESLQQELSQVRGAGSMSLLVVVSRNQPPSLPKHSERE